MGPIKEGLVECVTLGDKSCVILWAFITNYIYECPLSRIKAKGPKRSMILFKPIIGATIKNFPLIYWCPWGGEHKNEEKWQSKPPSEFGSTCLNVHLTVFFFWNWCQLNWLKMLQKDNLAAQCTLGLMHIKSGYSLDLPNYEITKSLS